MEEFHLEKIDLQHPLADKAHTILVDLCGIPASTADEYIEASDVVIAGLVGPKKKERIEALVVFETLRRRLVDSSYSSMYDRLIVLLPAKNFRAYYAQIFWWSPDQSLTSCGKVIDLFHDDIAQDASKIVLLVGGLKNENWNSLEAMLYGRGFKLSPDQFLKLEWELPPNEGDPEDQRFRELVYGGYRYRIWADCTIRLEELARCYNEALFAGDDRATVDDMRRIVENPLFDRELSIVASREEGPHDSYVGFAHVQRKDRRRAEIEMIAIEPEHRGQNLTMNAAPLFFAACARERIEFLQFTINPVNSRIRAIIDKHTNAKEIEHRLNLYRVTQGERNQ